MIPSSVLEVNVLHNDCRLSLQESHQKKKLLTSLHIQDRNMEIHSSAFYAYLDIYGIGQPIQFQLFLQYM